MSSNYGGRMYPGYPAYSPNPVDMVEDITDFLGNFQSRKSPGYVNVPPYPYPGAPAGFHNYHQDERDMQNGSGYEQFSPTPTRSIPGPSSARTSASRATRSSRSTATAATRQSSVFDSSGRSVASYTGTGTDTDAPDLNELTGDEVQAFHMTMPIAQRYGLPCEFSDLTGCTDVFDPADPDGWIRHSAEHFGRAGPPTNCICWFCDWQVDYGDRMYNYQQRMLHIREHYLEANHGQLPRRLDAHVLDRAWKYGLITSDVFEQQRNRHEAPQIEGLIPADASGERQRSRAERASRVYHDNQTDDRRHRRNRR